MKAKDKKAIVTFEQMMEAYNEAIDHYVNKNKYDYETQKAVNSMKQSITSYINKHFEMGER